MYSCGGKKNHRCVPRQSHSQTAVLLKAKEVCRLKSCCKLTLLRCFDSLLQFQRNSSLLLFTSTTTFIAFTCPHTPIIVLSSFSDSSWQIPLCRLCFHLFRLSWVKVLSFTKENVFCETLKEKKTERRKKETLERNAYFV